MIEQPYEGMQVTVDPSSARETGLLEVVGFVPGPAGMVAVDLGTDVTVSVDFADPGRMSSVTIPLDDTEPNRDIMTALFGFRGWDVLRTAVDVRLDRPIVAPLGKPLGRRLNSSLGSGGRPAQEFGMVIAGLSVVDDADEHPLVRGTAALESLRAMWESPYMGRSLLGHPAGRRRVDRWMTAAVEAFGDDLSGDQRLVELDPGAYRRLQECAMILTDRYDKGSRWPREIVRVLPQRRYDLDEERRRRRPTDSADDSVDDSIGVVRLAMSAPMALDDVVDFGVVDRSVRTPLVEITSPGRLRVEFLAEPNGSWLRVLERSSLGLLAVIPIRSERRVWRADAIVPSDLTVDEIEIIVADRPVADRPVPTAAMSTDSTSTIARTLEAIDAGRRAALLSARLELRASAAQWQVCAELWRGLGDDTRANLATAYASGRERVERVAQVHDDVRQLVD